MPPSQLQNGWSRRGNERARRTSVRGPHLRGEKKTRWLVICVQLTYEYAIVHKLGCRNSIRSLRWQKGPHSAGFLVHDWKQLAHFSENATWKWAIKVNQMILPLARLLDNGAIWACKCRSHGSTLSRLTGCQHGPVNGPHCVAKHCSVLDYFQCC